MNDTRLNTIAALVDDARTLIADIRDDCDGLPAEERMALEGIRRQLNYALNRVNALKDRQ